MARVLGYGGLANTNGARDFTGKETAIVASGGSVAIRRDAQIPGRLYRYGYGYRYIVRGVGALVGGLSGQPA